MKTEKSTYVKKGNNGGKRLGAGRKAFKPTDDDRKQVEAMAGFGVPFDQIATLIQGGISIDTLRHYFRKELLCGKAKANVQVGKSIFKKAISGDTSAMIWWSKCQMGWRDTHRIEHVSPDKSMSPSIPITKEEIIAELQARGLPTRIFGDDENIEP